MSREDDIKAAEDRAARKLKRLNLSGGSKGTRTPSPGSALAIANGAATAATSSSLVPVGNALQAVGFPSQKKQGGFGGFGGRGARARRGLCGLGLALPLYQGGMPADLVARLAHYSHFLHARRTEGPPIAHQVQWRVGRLPGNAILSLRCLFFF